MERLCHNCYEYTPDDDKDLICIHCGAEPVLEFFDRLNDLLDEEN